MAVAKISLHCILNERYSYIYFVLAPLLFALHVISEMMKSSLLVSFFVSSVFISSPLVPGLSHFSLF